MLPDQLLCFAYFVSGCHNRLSPRGTPAGLYVNGGVGVIECLKVIILSVLKPDLSNNGYEATSDIVTTVGDLQSRQEANRRLCQHFLQTVPQFEGSPG